MEDSDVDRDRDRDRRSPPPEACLTALTTQASKIVANSANHHRTVNLCS